MKTVTARELKEMALGVLVAAGLSNEGARLVADHLVEANLRGRDSHGVFRLPGIVAGIKNGAIRPKARPNLVRETPAAALMDGRRGLGQIVSMRATRLAVQKARQVGMGMVSVRGASHIGFLGYYTEYMARQGVIGLAFTNTEPAMSPCGGAEAILGTNPISIGIPTTDEPIVVDMATSVVARGKILELLQKGQRIPKGWAVDKEGQDTEDPAAALAGALLPIAGPKGYCLAFAFDVLSGALAGASVGADVKGTVHPEEVSTKGDLFTAIDPEVFCGYDKFIQRVERLKEQIGGCAKAPGVGEILLPGDPERKARQQRLEEGIPIDEKLWSRLAELAGATAPQPR